MAPYVYDIVSTDIVSTVWRHWVSYQTNKSLLWEYPWIPFMTCHVDLHVTSKMKITDLDKHFHINTSVSLGFDRLLLGHGRDLGMKGLVGISLIPRSSQTLLHHHHCRALLVALLMFGILTWHFDNHDVSCALSSSVALKLSESSIIDDPSTFVCCCSRH